MNIKVETGAHKIEIEMPPEQFEQALQVVANLAGESLRSVVAEVLPRLAAVIPPPKTT